MNENSVDQPPKDTAPGKSKFRWGRLLLAFSLALNLLVVGLVVGAIARFEHDDDDRPPVAGIDWRDSGQGPLIAAFSRSDKAALARSLRSEFGGFRENRDALRGYYGAVIAALKADPYDPAVLKELIDNTARTQSDRQGVAQRMILQRLDAMDAEDRAEYAKRLGQVLRRPAHGPRDRDDRRDD